ncbi:MAG: hypothetical protein LKE53_07945 [Oscillospiraceae bacterium]|jgi:hypothetical protein|nr:hypothetical protein [Oscillospiraceae bacterium]MDD3260922.1 hypothetical protein [Oscillospiraceae bacterium]
MEAAVLYCGARRTAYCQELLEGSGFQLAEICVAEKDQELPCLGRLLQKNKLVLILGPARSGQPAFCQPIFKALHVPMLEGSPQGVLTLQAEDCTGWLVESREQAVALLPDHPVYLAQLLPQLWLRLRRKFDLQQPKAGKPAPNYTKLVDSAFTGKEQL